MSEQARSGQVIWVTTTRSRNPPQNKFALTSSYSAYIFFVTSISCVKTRNSVADLVDSKLCFDFILGLLSIASFSIALRTF